jgi:hypothetical protein
MFCGFDWIEYEYGGSYLFRDVGNCLPVGVMSYPKRLESSVNTALRISISWDNLTLPPPIYNTKGTRWRSWLRHCATSRKVAGSIPDGVIGSFRWHNPSGRNVALGLTQPLTGTSTRNISWRGGGKGGRCVGLTTLPPSCADCLEIWEPQHPGTLRASPGL